MEDGFVKYLSFYLFISFCSFYIGRILPRRWFHCDGFLYRTRKFEHNGKLYEKLGIKKWQNRLPDMSRFFPKIVPAKNMSGNYKDRLPTMIEETCVAEFTHNALSLIGLHGLTLWDSPLRFPLTIIYIVVFNLPYVMIQRYNRPRLLRVYQKLMHSMSQGVACDQADPQCALNVQ